MRTTIYMGQSLDGFIARGDHRVDFLDPAGEHEPDDMGFVAFLATVDALVMGRRTWEFVASHLPETWFYGDTPVVVLSRTLSQETLTDRAPPGVRVRAGEPRRILEELAAEGAEHVYLDGGETARAFLAEGLVDELVITQVPVLIGEGLRLWGALPGDVPLRLLESRAFPNGCVQSRYAVLR